MKRVTLPTKIAIWILMFGLILAIQAFFGNTVAIASVAGLVALLWVETIDSRDQSRELDNGWNIGR